MLSVYSSRSNVKRAIESLKAQTYENWMCAIVTEPTFEDFTDEILSAIEGDDRFIFIPELKEQTYASCRNTAASLLGEVDYLTCLDGTDEFKPEHLSLREKFMSSYKEVAFIYGKMEVNGSQYIMDMFDRSHLIHVVNETSQGPTLFIRREVFEKMGGYRKMYGADGDLLYRSEDMKIKHHKLTDNVFRTYIYHREDLAND